MSGRRVAALLAAPLTALLIAGILAVGASAAPAQPLVERASCARPTGEPPAQPSLPGSTLVTFDVGATAWLRLADDGSVAAVATNSGCAPRPEDAFVVGGRAASPAEVADALSGFRSGDWRSPGTWHRR